MGLVRRWLGQLTGITDATWGWPQGTPPTVPPREPLRLDPDLMADQPVPDPSRTPRSEYGPTRRFRAK